MVDKLNIWNKLNLQNMKLMNLNFLDQFFATFRNQDFPPAGSYEIHSIALLLTVRSSGGRKGVPWHRHDSQGGSKSEVP
jgi:hypothetical protein